MVLLARVNGGSFQLWVCGEPSREWFEWLLRTDVALAPEQLQWKRIAQENRGMKTTTSRISRGGPQMCECRYTCDRCQTCEECECECHETPVAAMPPDPPLGPRGPVLLPCGHRYSCDRCTLCEECACRCDEEECPAEAGGKRFPV